MNDAEYKLKMDTVMGALAVANAISVNVTDEDLRVMEETGSQADALAFLLVHPMQLGKTDDRIKVQAEAIRVLREVRRFMVRGREHILQHGAGPVDVDVETIRKLSETENQDSPGPHTMPEITPGMVSPDPPGDTL